MKLLISCGGTGGHFYPGLGIAKYLQEHSGDALLIVGGKHAEEHQKTAQSQNVKIRAFPYVRPSKNPLILLKFFFAVLRGMVFTKKLIREFRPDAVLIMGSSISLPVTWGARRAGIPVFLHEGNALVGKANRALSRFAEKAALSFPAVNEKALHCPAVLTGFPLRTALTQSELDKTQALALLNEKYGISFHPAKPVLLVCGGSLGAKSINENFSVNPEDPDVKNLQVIHLAGPGKTESLKEKYASFPCPVLLLESSQEMDWIYGAADAVISRAGGSTVSELAFFGKYAFLIPYPYAAEHHQHANAAWLVNGGGAEMAEDSQCSPELFREFVSRFLSDVSGYQEKGRHSRQLVHSDAAGEVIAMIRQTLG